jgi:hypothetical protein
VRRSLSILRRLIALTMLSLALGACVSSYLLVGTPRAPIPASGVSVLVKTPAADYEEIALLETSSARSFSWTSQAKNDTVIRRLKREAARLGANAIVLHVLADGAPAAVGAGVGAAIVGTHGSVGFGVAGEGATAEKIGRATAIYMPAAPTRME